MKHILALFIALTIIFYPKTNSRVTMAYAFSDKPENKVNILPTQVKTPQNDELEALTHGYIQNDVEGLIWAYFGDHAPTMIAIGKAESGLNCLAVGDTTLTPSSYGVFQIRAFEGRPPVSDLLNCEKNIKYAKELFDRQGFTPWSAYNNESYLGFL